MADIDNRDVALVVEGRRYSGWKSIRITRSVENIAGTFALEVSDRWGYMDQPWPIMEEDACRVEIENGDSPIVVIDGYVDKRSISATKDGRSLTYSGSDRSAALVQNSAIVQADELGKGGKKWTFNNVDIAQFAAKLAKPFGIKISVQSGLNLAKVKKLVIAPGDTPFEALKKAAEVDGVLLVSDGAGGVLITQAGTSKAYSLVEGTNILTCSIDYDATNRFRTYHIATQPPGTDEAFGESLRVQATATDPGVRRADRVLMIRPDKGYDTKDARKRADWEARIRAAKAESPTIGVQGWTQGNGLLWPPNAKLHVTAPRLLGVDGDMVISQVEHSINSEGGRITQLSLVRPDAFTPEPKAEVKESGGAWKELKDGAK